MITRLQLCILIILTTGLMNHILIISKVFDAAGRDAWLSVIFAVIPAFVWIAVISYSLKRIGKQPLKTYLDRQGHVLLSWFVLFTLSVYLVLIAAITTKVTMDWIEMTYLPFTPKWVISFVFAALCVITASRGIRVIAIIGGILLPFVILLVFFVMTANSPNMHYEMLLPLLEHGFPPLFGGGFYVGAGFAELVLILMLTHRLEKPPSYKILLLLIIILAGLTIGPLIGGITEFGPQESAKQRYPLFEQWRLVRIGRYIDRVDSLSLYHWLSGSWVRITLALYLVSDLFQRKAYVARGSLLALGLLIFAAGVAPLSPEKLRMLLVQYYFPASVCAAGAILLITAGLGLRKPSKEG